MKTPISSNIPNPNISSNTASAASVLSTPNVVNASSSLFSMVYSKQLLHVVCEFVVIGLTSYYFYKKTNSLSNQIKILEAKIEKLEKESKTQKEEMNEKFSEIISFVSSMSTRFQSQSYYTQQPTPPQPVPTPQPILTPQPVPSTPPKTMTKRDAENVQKLQNEIEVVSRKIEQKIGSTFGPSASVNAQVILDAQNTQRERENVGSNRSDIIMMEVVIPSFPSSNTSSNTAKNKENSMLIEEYDENEFDEVDNKNENKEKELDNELEQEGLLEELK
jgi:uncharacterized membrane-anchored protein YhcB (DUF1043 family)